MAESLRRRPAPGQDQSPGHPRPAPAVGKKSQTSGGCRGRVPMPKPMGSPGMRGQGSRSRPAPPPGEPGRILKARTPAPALSHATGKGAGTGPGPGRVNHGCQPSSGGSPPEAETGFPDHPKATGPGTDPRAAASALPPLTNRGGLLTGEKAKIIPSPCHPTGCIEYASSRAYSGPNVRVLDRPTVVPE